MSPYNLAIECDDLKGLLVQIDHPGAMGWMKTYKRQWETAKSIALLPKVPGQLPPVRVVIPEGARAVYYSLVRGQIIGPMKAQKRTFCIGWTLKGNKTVVAVSERGEILMYSPKR
jgi:hypothetical protein